MTEAESRRVLEVLQMNLSNLRAALPTLTDEQLIASWEMRGEPLIGGDVMRAYLSEIDRREAQA